MQFSIPLQRSELTKNNGPDQYQVRQDYSVRELKTKLRDCSSRVARGGCGYIVDEDGFDILFSVLDNFHSEMPTDHKRTAMETLIVAATDWARQADAFLCSADSSNGDEKKRQVTTMKMVFYLLCQFVEMFESDAVQMDSAAAVGGKGKKGKKAMPRFDDDDDAAVAWDWDARRQESVTVMFRLVNLNIGALFSPPIVEEEFRDLIGNCMFKLLENPSVAHQKCNGLRTSVLQVLGTMNAKFNYALSFRLKIVQGLKHFEHLVTPCGEAIEMSTTEFGCKNMVMETVRELSRLDSRELSRDTSGTRAYSLFLVELAERLPEAIQPSLSLLLHHLDGESYMLRKSILYVFQEIVLKLYSGESLEPAAKEARDQYLDHLEDHVHDVHAFVRSGVLQAWNKLCLAKAIPLTRQYKLLTLVVGRLQDKSSNVRKQAVQLLNGLLQCNPYNAVLPVEELKESYKKELDKLTAMKPQPDNEEAERLKTWPTIQKGLTDYLDEEEEDEDGESEGLWENASPGEVHERIRHHLTRKKYDRAVKLFSLALAEFPIFKKLEALSQEAEKEQQGDEAEEGDKEELDPIVAQLKTIFFLPLPAMSQNADDSVASQDSTQGGQDELAKQTFLVNYLRDSVRFASMLNEALPVVCMLLGSKQITDVQEAISFFVSAFEFGLLNAMMGVRKMLSLIFSRETTIQNSVVTAYKRLYIDPPDENRSRNNEVAVVRNLTALVGGATIGDLAGLEELIGLLVKDKSIDKKEFQVLWQCFTKMTPDITEQQSQSALVLLGMIATTEPSVIITNVNFLIEHGLGERGEANFRLVHDTCATLLKIATATKVSSSDPEPPFKFPSDHELFVRLEKLLDQGFDNMADQQYIPMVQQAVAVIYQLSELPDQLAGRLCRTLVARFAEKKKRGEVSQLHLSRLVFLFGHVAICHLNYLDVAVFNELKRRNTLRDLKKEKKNAQKQSQKNSSRRKSLSARNMSASASFLSAADGGTPRPGRAGKDQAAKDEDDDQDEIVGAEADDAEAEFIRSVCEKEVVMGAGTPTANLLAAFAPVVIDVCSNPNKYTHPSLQSSGAMALAKYMMVSSEFCEENLQLLFTILEKSRDPVIRANTIIAAGDLSFRFPNTVEPWTPRMYACLRDDSPKVRSNTLTVLTHLILNDMIKVRGQISDMALCIVDDISKISNLAKLFFTELARKGNALYNIMPDIISGLSDTKVGVEEDKFREIMKYIISLIEKDKHLEALVEKLCLRFRVTKTERQWRDLAFCLSNFTYSDKAVKKLIENFECFSDKLHEDSVYEAFNTIMAMAKKVIGAKNETKLAIEELNEKIETSRAKGVEDDTANKRAKNAAAGGKGNKGGGRQANAKAKTPARRRTRQVESDSESEEEDKESDGEEEEEAPAKENQPENTPAKTPAGSKRRAAAAARRDEEGFAVPKTPVIPAPAATPSSSRPKRATRSRR